MNNPDLIFSLGPNCRITWNLRHYFGTDRAYPFDWWITPARSMIDLLDRDRKFHVEMDDLVVTPPEGDTNTVYNRRLHLLHHHDFPRIRGVVQPVTQEEVAKLNAKYTALFARLWDDLDKAERPLAVLNGIDAGWQTDGPDGSRDHPLNGGIQPQAMVDAVRQRLGSKLRLLVISIGDAGREDLDGGTMIRVPDPGPQHDPPEAPRFAKPVQAFRDAFSVAGLAPGAPGTANPTAAAAGNSEPAPGLQQT